MKSDAAKALCSILTRPCGVIPHLAHRADQPAKLAEGVRNSRLFGERIFVLRDGKTPVNVQGCKTGWKDPGNRYTGPEVEKLAAETGHQIGIIMPAGYFFVDIDHALLPDGTWSEKAQEIASLFPGAYFELSQSQTGFHILAHAAYVPEHRQKNSKLGVEIYSKPDSRHCALTGYGASGNIDAERAPGLMLCLRAADLAIEPGTATDTTADVWRDELSPDGDDARLKSF